jgi:serine/threonine-protein kinase
VEKAGGRIPPLLGALINRRYRVEGQLGDGGGGEVFLVRDLWRDGEHVALKLLKGFQADRSTLRRFGNEFFSLRRLHHPNLVRVFEYGRVEDRDRLFYTMEYLEGTDLAAHCVGSAPEGLVPLAIQVCRGLLFLHSRGILHGDIKPGNLRVLEDGETGPLVKLTDFGLSRSMGEESVRGEEPHGGTVAFMAPEVLRGREPDGRSDLYSLGVVLYRCVAGFCPFTGDPLYVAKRRFPQTARSPTGCGRRSSGSLPSIPGRGTPMPQRC